MTISLRELQENLQTYLLTGDAATIAKNIVSPAQGAINTRLAIYRDSYYLCLTNTLRKDFPVLEQLLGEQAFEALAIAYINAHPSAYCSINNFSSRLPAFLQSAQPYAQQLYLSELAELSWELDKTLITADAPLLTVNDLALIPQDKWGELQLIFHPSVKLLEQQYNTFDIWQALQQNKPLPPIVKSAKPTNCLLGRKALTPYCRLLTAEAVCIISALQARRTFADVCERLTDYLPEEEVAQYAVNQVVNWLNQGVFSELKY